MNPMLGVLLPDLWLVLARLGLFAGLVLFAIGGFALVNSRRYRRDEQGTEPPQLIAYQMKPELPARYRGRRRRRRPRQPRARRKPRTRRWVPVGVAALMEQARREAHPVVRKLAGWRRPADKERSRP